jgi:hypothetical protein
LLSTSFCASGGALLGVAGVVFGQQFELDLLAADRHALGIELFDGHAGAVFIVLAQVGNGAAGGPTWPILTTRSCAKAEPPSRMAAAPTITFSLTCMQIPPEGVLSERQI